MRWLSPAQIDLFKRCPMQWAYKYVHKIKEPATPAMLAGIQSHDEIAKAILAWEPTTPATRAAIEYLQAEGLEGSPEEGIENEDLHLRGRVDWIGNDAKDRPVLVDWKTSDKLDPSDRYRLKMAVYDLALDTPDIDHRVVFIDRKTGKHAEVKYRFDNMERALLDAEIVRMRETMGAASEIQPLAAGSAPCAGCFHAARCAARRSEMEIPESIFERVRALPESTQAKIRSRSADGSLEGGVRAIWADVGEAGVVAAIERDEAAMKSAATAKPPGYGDQRRSDPEIAEIAGIGETLAAACKEELGTASIRGVARIAIEDRAKVRAIRGMSDTKIDRIVELSGVPRAEAAAEESAPASDDTDQAQIGRLERENYDLRVEVEALKNAQSGPVVELEQEIAELKALVDALKSSHDEKAGKILDLGHEVDALRAGLAEWKERADYYMEQAAQLQREIDAGAHCGPAPEPTYPVAAQRLADDLSIPVTEAIAYACASLMNNH